MSYRGVGGFGGGMRLRPRRRRVMAGDMGDFGDDFAGGGVYSEDYSDAGSFDPGTAADPTDESAGLDMSPVTDTVASAGIPDLGGGLSLAGLGGALAPLGGLGSALGGLLGSGAGSAAAAGMGALANPKTRAAVKKALKYGIGGLLRGRRSGRRMNPGNFRALHRALRRLTSFEHAAKRVYRFTHPARGHSHFKFRRRRRKR